MDSRATREGATIRRRRECLKCGYRYTTYEEIEHEGLMVVKRDGRREEFSREKLALGLRKACQKRPISPETIDELVGRIVEEISEKYEREVPGSDIGERVMVGLRNLDEVAYVRFASVYRDFADVGELIDEAQEVKDAAATAKGQQVLFTEEESAE